MRPRGILVSCSLVVAALWGSGARAEPGAGPPLGALTYATSIDTVDAVEDVDPYSADLLEGERLTVTVTASGSPLLPDVALVKPDGTVLRRPELPATSRSGGRSISLRSFTADASGTWTVLVSGQNGTEGAYRITSSIAARRPLRPFRGALNDTAGLTAEHAFPGVAGASVDLTLSWGRRDAPVAFRSLKDPLGAEVQGASGDAVLGAVARGRTGRRLRVVLPGPGGTHRVTVGVDSGTARYSLKVALRPPVRPKSRRPVTISGVEPRLAARATPERTITGRRVTVAGTGFATTTAPRVWFGAAEGANVVVGAGGTSLQADVPAGADGTVVALTVRNPDGQSARVPDAFAYVGPPTITDLTTPDGDPRRGGPLAGGAVLRLRGTDFAAGFTVRFGTNAVPATFLDASTLEFGVPAGPAGSASVSVTDEFGRTVVAPFSYVYKAPPTIAATAATAYSPVYAAVAGGTVVTVTGSGFTTGDTLAFDGGSVTLTFVNATTVRFTSPARAAGTYSVTVTDVNGSSVTGPLFEVKAPPTVTGVAVTSGPVLPAGSRNVPFGGGNGLRVTGTGFRTGDTVTLGGAALTATAATATQFDATVPASTTPGAQSLVVTDLVGQAATFASAVRRVGYLDASATRAPAPSSADDFSGWRGVLRDLDGDGSVDLTMSSMDSPGSRAKWTRFLQGDGTSLADATDPFVPAPDSVFGTRETWKGVLAVGDVDGDSAADDVVVAGPGYDSIGYAYRNLRTLVGDGGSPPALAIDTFRSPVATHPTYYAYYYGTGATVKLFSDFGRAPALTDLALGDVDGDGDLDAVACAAQYRTGSVFVNENYWSRGDSGVSLLSGYSYYNYGYYRYRPALQVFDQRVVYDAGSASLVGAFVETSFTALPLAGSYPSTAPALPGRALALGDVDGDSDLDVVVTWDDPTTTTPYGLWKGNGVDSARTATQVLVNRGTGVFDVDTASWLPAGSSPEFWQGTRVALEDLDGDGDLDLVLVHAQSTDAYLGTPTFTSPALRVLRNDGAGTGFTDVSATVLPAVPLAGTRDDNLRGTALRVADVDGDGNLDILVGTTEALVDGSGRAVRRTRLLRGGATLGFTDATAFLPPPSADTGEADDLLVGDVAGRTDPSLVLVSETAPAASAASRFTRVFDWYR